MDRIDAVVAASRAQGLKPWLAIKSELAAAVVKAMRSEEGPAILQGGAAVHFAYGSPRLSVDVDYAGIGSTECVARAGPAITEAVASILGRPASWSFKLAGKLGRAKIGVTLDGARSLALPVEACEVPVHRPRRHATAGLVEAPEELIADKLVATALRLRERGCFKVTDVFDIWFLLEEGGAAAPEKALVAEKLADFGAGPEGTDVAGAIRSLSAEELSSVLKGVLPAREIGRLSAEGMIARVVALAEEYRDVY